MGISVGFFVVAAWEVNEGFDGGGIFGVEGDAVIDGAVDIFESIFGSSDVAR